MANPASQTAVGPMAIVAEEQHLPEAQRIVQDDLAYHVLPRGVQALVRLTRWGPLRNLLVRMSERSAAGIWGSLLCRKRYIDDKLHEALGAIDAVVILGAGLDTRAYRMADQTTLPLFEVDLPENIAYKQARMRRLYGQMPPSVRLVPIDFERQRLDAALAEQGHRPGQRTFFVWEGVTQYLTEEAVRTTFDALAMAAPGSRLVFTYIRQDFLDGAELYGAAKLYRQFRVKQTLWRFGMAPERVHAFLQTYGWRQVEQMGGREFAARYMRPAGRTLPVSEVERSVYAVKI